LDLPKQRVIPTDFDSVKQMERPKEINSVTLKVKARGLRWGFHLLMAINSVIPMGFRMGSPTQRGLYLDLHSDSLRGFHLDFLTVTSMVMHWQRG
jgi:hypothetical protein